MTLIKSTDGTFRAEVIGADSDPDQHVKIWLWSYRESRWLFADDVRSVEELARFVDLKTLYVLEP